MGPSVNRNPPASFSILASGGTISFNAGSFYYLRWGFAYRHFRRSVEIQVADLIQMKFCGLYEYWAVDAKDAS